MFNCIIIQSSNQIDSQHKAATAISIPLAQDSEDFQMPNDVFDHDPLRCQLFVKLFLLIGQLATFRFLKRRSRVFVQRKQTLITAVCQTLDIFGQVRLAMLVKRKVVPSAFGKSRINDLFGLPASPDLRFYRVSLFLARIVSFLFFFGRSIGDSATSTTTTSISGDRSAKRLPGKVNSFESVRMSSTRAIMRETALSEIPQLVPRWNIVRYSRQYSSVNNTWSSVSSFGGLPDTSRWAADLVRTISHILSKVLRSTPQYRLKLAADNSFNFS